MVTSETGTKATRGHFLNSFGEAVIIAERSTKLPWPPSGSRN
jgi:hypothetical protein